MEITSDRGLLLHLFQATMNLAPIGVLRIFGNKCIMGRVLPCPVTLRSNVFNI